MPPEDWVALVERGGCSFEEKVRVAQNLGAVAVVVGDAAYEMDVDSAIERLVNLRDIPWDNDEWDQGATRPITMEPSTDAEDITIPSCFVIRSAYLDLMELVHKRLTAKPGALKAPLEGLPVGLFLDASLPDLSTMDLGMLLLFLPSFLTVFFIVFHHLQAFVKRFRARASAHAVQKLPCYAWHPERSWDRVILSTRPAPKEGDGVLAYGTYYLGCVYDQLHQRLACHRGGYQPLVSSETLEEQPILAVRGALPVHTQPAPPSVAAALDVRRYAQDVCPICLAEFVDGYVAVLTQRPRACPALWPCIPSGRSVRRATHPATDGSQAPGVCAPRANATSRRRQVRNASTYAPASTSTRCGTRPKRPLCLLTPCRTPVSNQTVSAHVPLGTCPTILSRMVRTTFM